jgi:tyrosine-specific transport protein
LNQQYRVPSSRIVTANQIMIKRKLQLYTAGAALGGLTAVPVALAFSFGTVASSQQRRPRIQSALWLSSIPAPSDQYYTGRMSERSKVSAVAMPIQMEEVYATTTATAFPLTTDTAKTWVMDSFIPVVSAALLITGNTVGAGCLVMPELATGPGLSAVVGMYGVAWFLNLVSGLVLAEVAISQKENGTTGSDDVPSSFKDFAATNLGSPAAANVVSAISLFVNACVLAFDLSRAGTVGAALSGIDEHTISIAAAVAVATAITKLSTGRLSLLCSACVAALFISFGGLLLPGMAAVPDVEAVFAVPGASPDVWSSMSSTFPIILMSMIFQNIVPVVVKLLGYDRTKSVTAITLGSMIPLSMYTAWCFACLGGGIDANGCGPLITIFSVATLAGSSLCTSMSLAEELDTAFKSSPLQDVSKEATCSHINMSEDQETLDTCFPVPAAVTSVALPLVAALAFGGEGGLTGALAIAGSFGSPILYGLLPALMAWRQRQDQPLQPQRQYMIPAPTLPVLGLLSTGFVGQEMLTCLHDLVGFVS